MSDNKPMNLYPSVIPTVPLSRSLQVGCICGCKRLARYRGLYQACYDKICAKVRAGEVTWEQLVADGKALPSTSRRAGRSGGVGE